ncbi:Eaa1 [Klebsiella variicola]|nr:Eaa1 [Klebsiella variicola]
MQFLMWDAQRRAGITDEQITQAMIEKLAVNKQRSWPEPKDGEPRLHIKEQQAPVVPDFKKLARELVDNLVDVGSLDTGVKEQYLVWAEKTCRAAMLAACPAGGVKPYISFTFRARLNQIFECIILSSSKKRR